MNEPYQLNQLPLEKKRSPIKIIIVAAVILLVGIGLYVYLTPTEKLPEFISKPVSKEIPSVTAVLAASIDSDFNYAVQPNKEYYEGNPLFVYVEIRDFVQNSDFSVDISEDIEVKDSQNNIMFAKSRFAVLNEKYSRKMAVLILDNGIKTEGWKPGNYVLNIRINDNLAKKSTMKSFDFAIKKVPANQFISTVDLSSIVSSSTLSSDLAKTQIVRDSSGNVIQELNATQAVTGDLSKLNLKFIGASFVMPERFNAGTYNVKITYTNTKTGGTVSSQGSVVLDGKFEISEFVFAAKINNDYSYEAQPNKEYKQGSDVLVYLKLVNFAQPLINGSYSVKFMQDLSIRDKSGKVVLSQNGYIKIDDLNNVKNDGYNIKNSISFLPKGDYVYKVTIKDLNNAQEAVREEVFQLK
ncbi:TPA: hypothetical protein HA219_01630 [Candidatus Woesearchaeota archaeon]|nr:hypothetical protein [Candidatus Woesearchaeota archaeon]HIH39406.1 hypothetical protein [Candidatus Woesearchaeota archaeon]